MVATARSFTSCAQAEIWTLVILARSSHCWTLPTIFNRILKWRKRVFHAVSRPITGTLTAQRAPGKSGACVNRVQPRTVSSNCLRVGSFSLEKCQWKNSLGKCGYL